MRFLFVIKNLVEIIWDKLRGVKYGEKNVKEFDLTEKTTINRIQSIIAELDNRVVLSFYDAFYELKPLSKPMLFGDEGAFTDVIKNRKTFMIRLGNHGGFKNNGRWIKISEKELIDRIFRSRQYNGGKIQITSRVVRRQWRKIKNGKAFYEFYYDITDKK